MKIGLDPAGTIVTPQYLHRDHLASVRFVSGRPQASTAVTDTEETLYHAGSKLVTAKKYQARRFRPPSGGMGCAPYALPMAQGKW